MCSVVQRRRNVFQRTDISRETEIGGCIPQTSCRNFAESTFHLVLTASKSKSAKNWTPEDVEWSRVVSVGAISWLSRRAGSDEGLLGFLLRWSRQYHVNRKQPRFQYVHVEEARKTTAPVCLFDHGMGFSKVAHHLQNTCFGQWKEDIENFNQIQ